jgi:DNA-binding CsgD family transcriptional regulator
MVALTDDASAAISPAGTTGGLRWTLPSSDVYVPARKRGRLVVKRRLRSERRFVDDGAFVGLPEVPRDLGAYGFTVEGEEYVVFAFRSMATPRRDRLDEGLTAGERAVVDLVLRGRSNREVALARGTSPQTVANQLGLVYRKLGVRSRRELIARKRAETG